MNTLDGPSSNRMKILLNWRVINLDSTIATVIIVTIAIITAAIIGILKFRAKSEERKTSDGIEFSPEVVERQKEDEKNRRQNNDRDIPAFIRLQQFIDSNWIRNFEDNQLTYPQYVQVAVTDDLHAYCNESRKPENEFSNQNLAKAHLMFVKAIKVFINTVLRETTFVRPESKSAVINSKAKGYRKPSHDYEQRYEREVKIITSKAKGIINTYKRYVQVAKNESVYLQDC